MLLLDMLLENAIRDAIRCHRCYAAHATFQLHARVVL